MNTQMLSKQIRVETQERPIFSAFSIIAMFSCCIALMVVFFFLTASYHDARDQFMERLEMERQAVETNKALKTELGAITQKGYMEFAAGERLGLKKANDQEVVVLR